MVKNKDDELGKFGNRIQRLSNKMDMMMDDFEEYKKKSIIEIKNNGVAVVEHLDSIIELQTQKHLQAYTIHVKNEIKEDIAFATDNLRQTATQIFFQSKFIQGLENRLIKIIDEQVRVSVKNADLHKFVGKILQQHLKDNLNGLVSNIVRSLVDSINKKLTTDYQTTKKLIYSIDAEIRHTLMKCPISSDTEAMIQKEIMKVLEKVPIKNKTIEVKNDKK